MSVARPLRNTTRNAVVATSVRKAVTPWSRGIGLLGRAKVDPHEGLWIGGCSAVHTVGMRATIDLIFLDRDQVVLEIVKAVAPQRLAVVCRGAKTVVELGSGGDLASRVNVGDRLVLE